MRIDDTDKERSKKEYEEDIIKGFKLLDLEWDNKETIRQSERTSIYKKHLEKLLAENKIYFSKEEPASVPMDIGTTARRREVIRFRNPNKKIEFDDVIRGKVSFDTTELGDFVVAKTLDEPIYHFASVVDDFKMGITHVIRAEEHLSNTPRQILIQEAIGAERPIYGHVPLILAADRSKLSKRNGAVALKDFLAAGYLPEAILNYLALLGWHPAGNREIFTKDELIKEFDLSRVQKGGAIWNTEKLDWVNKEHLKKMNKKLRITNYEKELKKVGVEIFNKEILEKIEPILTERINKFGDIKTMAEGGELTYFFQMPEYPKEMLLWKKDKDASRTRERLQKFRQRLNLCLNSGFNLKELSENLMALAEKEGRGEVLWPLRVALSGQEKSPDPFTLLEIFGREESLARLDKAINLLS